MRKINECYITTQGYRMQMINSIPKLEHRRVWEEHHKRKIPKGLKIHHIDGNRLNNSIENLQLLTQRSHSRIHYGHKKVNGEWQKACVGCGEFKPLPEYYSKYQGTQSRCKPCTSKYSKRYRFRLPFEMRLPSSRCGPRLSPEKTKEAINKLLLSTCPARLARELDVGPTAIHRWKSGKIAGPEWLLNPNSRIADALQVTTDYLLRDEAPEAT